LFPPFDYAEDEYHIRILVQPLNIAIILVGPFKCASGCIEAVVYKH